MIYLYFGMPGDDVSEVDVSEISSAPPGPNSCARRWSCGANHPVTVQCNRAMYSSYDLLHSLRRFCLNLPNQRNTIGAFDAPQMSRMSELVRHTARTDRSVHTRKHAAKRPVRPGPCALR